MSPANSDDISEETKPDYLRRTNSSSSIVTLGMHVITLLQHNCNKNFLFLDAYQSTAAFNQIHSQLWKGLTTLEHDICPDVSNTAQKLTKYIRQKVSNVWYIAIFIVLNIYLL